MPVDDHRARPPVGGDRRERLVLDAERSASRTCAPAVGHRAQHLAGVAAASSAVRVVEDGVVRQRCRSAGVATAGAPRRSSSTGMSSRTG